MVCKVINHNFRIVKQDLFNDFGKKTGFNWVVEGVPSGCEKISWAMGKDYPSYTFYWFNYGDDMHPSEVL